MDVYNSNSFVGRCNSGSRLDSGGPHFNVQCSNLVGNEVRLTKSNGTNFSTIHAIAILSSASINTPCTKSLTTTYSSHYHEHGVDWTQISPTSIVESLTPFWTDKGYTQYYVYEIIESPYTDVYVVRWDSVSNGDCMYTEEINWLQEGGTLENVSAQSSRFTQF